MGRSGPQEGLPRGGVQEGPRVGAQGAARICCSLGSPGDGRRGAVAALKKDETQKMPEIASQGSKMAAVDADPVIFFTETPIRPGRPARPSRTAGRVRPGFRWGLGRACPGWGSGRVRGGSGPGQVPGQVRARAGPGRGLGPKDLAVPSGGQRRPRRRAWPDGKERPPGPGVP